MKKLFLEAEKLTEDKVVTLKYVPEFDSKIVSKKLYYTYLTEKEAKEFEITDRTTDFLDWAQEICDMIERRSYESTSTYDSQQLFVEKVLHLNTMGAEYLHNLLDYIVEVDFNAINYTTDIIAPDRLDYCADARLYDHIYKIDMPSTILVAITRQWILTIVSEIIDRLLLKHIPFEEIKKAVRGVRVYEHLDAPENLAKQLRKDYLDLQYALGHNYHSQKKAIEDRLTHQLDGIAWELKYTDYSDKSTHELRGVGFNTALSDLLTSTSKAIDISSFSIWENDF